VARTFLYGDPQSAYNTILEPESPRPAGENERVQSTGRGSDTAVLFLSYTTNPLKISSFITKNVYDKIKYYKILVWARNQCDLHCVNSVKSTRIQTGIA
jgi:hypothetical protein